MLHRDHRDGGGDVPERMMRAELGVDLGDGHDDEEKLKEQLEAEQTAESKAADNSDSPPETGEEPPEKAEDTPGDDDQEPEEQPNDDLEPLRSRGLDRQFKSVDEALDYIPGANRHITTLEQDRARILADIAKPKQDKPPVKPEAFDLEKFENNPDEYLAEYNQSRGFVSREDVMRMVDAKMAAKEEHDATMAVLDTKRNPRLKELGPMMSQIFLEEEALVRSLPTSKGMQYLYNMACARVPAKSHMSSVALSERSELPDSELEATMRGNQTPSWNRIDI